MAGMIMMGVGYGLQAYEASEAGKEAKRQADQAAASLRIEEGQLAAMTQEKLHDIKKDTYFAKGEAKAFGAMGGSKVGTGSSLTLLNRIEGAARRKSEVLTKGTSAQRAALLTDASEYERRGKDRLRAGKRGAWSSILTGGYQFGQQMWGWGK